MSLHPLDPHDLEPDEVAGRGVDSAGVRTRVRTLTRGCAAVLAALTIAVVYLAGSPPSESARQVRLGEAADWPRAISFGPGGEVLAATTLDGVIRLWRIDPASGRAIPSVQALSSFVAAFSPDGTTLAVGGDSTVTFGEAAPGRPWHALPTGDGSTSALAFRRDGKALAAACERSVRVWDLVPGQKGAGTRLELRGVKSLAFAPDGRSLATGSEDGSVGLWDLATGRQQFAVRAHGPYVSALAFSDDGRMLVSASDCDQVAWSGRRRAAAQRCGVTPRRSRRWCSPPAGRWWPRRGRTRRCGSGTSPRAGSGSPCGAAASPPARWRSPPAAGRWPPAASARRSESGTSPSSRAPRRRGRCGHEERTGARNRAGSLRSCSHDPPPR